MRSDRDSLIEIEVVWILLDIRLCDSAQLFSAESAVQSLAPVYRYRDIQN